MIQSLSSSDNIHSVVVVVVVVYQLMSGVSANRREVNGAFALGDLYESANNVTIYLQVRRFTNTNIPSTYKHTNIRYHKHSCFLTSPPPPPSCDRDTYVHVCMLV